MGHWPELLIILLLALIVFGPKRLPEVGQMLGRALREFRKVTSELERAVSLDVEPAPQARPTPQPAPSSEGLRLNPPLVGAPTPDLVATTADITPEDLHEPPAP